MIEYWDSQCLDTLLKKKLAFERFPAALTAHLRKRTVAGAALRKC